MKLRLPLRPALLALSTAFFAVSPVPALAQVGWGAVLRQDAAWYASPEARQIATSVLQYQSSEGAWPKNTDMSRPPPSADFLEQPEIRGSSNTIDNGATTTQIRFLALVTSATNDGRYRPAIERGIDYLLRAQYPSGGWPQFYPLREGYYSHVTFNDDAMVRVMELLREVARGAAPYAFVGEPLRARAAAAVERGVDVMLKTQIRQAGHLAGWCAQYDETTLEPAWARAYEPPSLSGGETVGIVRFLMGIENPSPEVAAAIDGAVAWLRAVEIDGMRIEGFTDAEGRRDRRVVADPTAGPLWARFYGLDTNLPIFLGRDSQIHYALSEIEHERRNGYSYYGSWAADLLAREYPAWRGMN